MEANGGDFVFRMRGGRAAGVVGLELRFDIQAEPRLDKFLSKILFDFEMLFGRAEQLLETEMAGEEDPVTCEALVRDFPDLVAAYGGNVRQCYLHFCEAWLFRRDLERVLEVSRLSRLQRECLTRRIWLLKGLTDASTGIPPNLLAEGYAHHCQRQTIPIGYATSQFE